MRSNSLFNGIVKFVGGTALGVSVALLLSFNALLLWVATGPRNIDMLSPFIEVSLTDSSHTYSVSIGETWLIWDGWKHPIDIRLRNVSVLTRERQRFSRFPEISVGMDVPELLRGNLLPSSLTLTHPVLSLYQRDDRSISFGFRPENAEEGASPAGETPPADEQFTDMSVPFSAVLSQLVDPDDRSPLRKLRSVTILNADISVGNTRSGVFFNAREANLVFKNTRRATQAFGSAKIAYGETESSIDASFTLPRDEPVITGEVAFGPLMPGTLADLFASRTEISALKFPVRGKAKLAFERSGGLQSLDFTLDGGQGTVESERLDSVLPVTGIHAEGALTGGGKEIALRRLVMDLGGMLVEASGTGQVNGDQSSVRAHLQARNIPNDTMHMLWPLGLAPLSREWLTRNIYGGTYTEAVAQVDIKPGDLALPVLPRESVDATIHIRDASISYLPEHPEVSRVSGTIHVDGLSLEAKIHEGRYLRDTALANATVRIGDLNEDNPYITLEFDAQSSGRDLVKFLGLPRLGHARRLSLSEDAAEGAVKGHASLGFRFFAGDAQDDITYAIEADAKDMRQPHLLGRFDIQNAAGHVALDNRRIRFTGTGTVNGAQASKADVTYLFTPENGFDTFIETSAVAPVASLPRFGYPALDFMKGSLGVSASLKIGAERETVTALLDLTPAAIDFHPVRYAKPEGEAASLEFMAEKKDGITAIPSFRIQGKNLDGAGRADVSADRSGLARVRMDRLTYGGTKLDSLLYEKRDGGLRLEARGASADLSRWFAYKEGEAGFSFQHFPVLQLDVDLRQVTLGENRELKHIRGRMECDRVRCNSADIDGRTTDNKPFQFRILRNPKGRRQVSLHAESAGPFLKAVGVFDSMEGGDLTITGSFSDRSDHGILTARADITAYTVKDAPVLAKILSLASLTGFFDTLVGKGIMFSRLRAPFTLSRDVITVKEAKTYGDAMGMTMEGTITFPKQALDLHGTIVPSYSLNTVLGKVPVIGAALMGGEGKGVFAASYSIRGSGNAPEVMVNPLSILTPGFLRGLFDIFDNPGKAPEEEAEGE